MCAIKKKLLTQIILIFLLFKSFKELFLIFYNKNNNKREIHAKHFSRILLT